MNRTMPFPRLFSAGLLALSALLSACGGEQPKEQFPQDPQIERKDARGRLTGDSGLFSLGGSEEEKTSTASPIGVNGFLWRAALDTLSFLPLASADPFGGTIITDWYEDPKAPGERYKVNAVILDKTLRADGVRVSVFKQKLDGGVWRDQPQDERLSRKVEDTILTRARELRIAQLGH
ncbi:MAG: DUF3576 domain-containing protein [Alphaproteobacteria bacterium]|nr:DUF3576 domain-containing protein [Alphaproteobacteria bacterium]